MHIELFLGDFARLNKAIFCNTLMQDGQLQLFDLSKKGM